MFAALLVGVVLSLAGCHRSVTDPNDPKFIVAEKGDWNITRGQLDTEVNNFLKAQGATVDQVGPAKMPMVQTGVLDNMVLKKLLLDRAAALPPKDLSQQEAQALAQIQNSVPPGTDFNTALKSANMTLDDLKKNIHERALIQNVIQTDALQNAEPTQQEVDDYYVKHQSSFVIPPKIRASRVLILVDPTISPADKAAKKKAIDAARARVAKGEDFAKVATEVSQDRYSAPKGGDVGFFQKGENEPQFDDMAFHMKLNDVSPVFETQMGYQFLKVTDTHPGTQLTAAEAQPYISAGLRKQKSQQLVEAYTKHLLDNSGVNFHFQRVDPPSQLQQSAGAPQQAPDGAAPAPAPNAPSGT
jgi:peptidyl-prolyl cis-trans isomerase C